MEIIAALCLWWAWAAPTDFMVNYYDVFLDYELYIEEVVENEARVCVTDWEEHVIEVQAVDPDGHGGPLSDATFRVFHGPHPGPTVCSDINGNGIVGFEDFGIFTGRFGKCQQYGQGASCSDVLD
jgi:hypothetical protein